MTLLLVVFWIAVGAVVVTVALTVAVRIRSEIARRRLAGYERGLRDRLTAYVVGVRDDPPRPPRDRFEQRVLRRDLVALSPSVKGEAADRVAELFVACGLVDVARRDLDARDSLTRIRAAEALGAMGVSDAVPWLAERLRHHDALLRLACARALAERSAVDTLPEIVGALEEADTDPGDVAEVFVAFGAVGVPFLRGLLRQGSQYERRLAAVALGNVGAHQALPELRAALGDEDRQVDRRRPRWRDRGDERARGRHNDAAVAVALRAAGRRLSQPASERSASCTAPVTRSSIARPALASVSQARW